MSYEIIYDKQFVKLPDNKYIPMLYWGSNNCIQFDRSSRGRRERNWSAFSWIAGGKQFATAEEMLAKLAEEEAKLPEYKKDEHDPDPAKSFGYYTSLQIGTSTRTTTFGMYAGLITTGIRKALTVEQLATENVHVEVSTYAYDEEKTKAKMAEQGIPWLGSQTATSTEHLVQLLEQYSSLYDGKFSWHVSFDWDIERRVKWLRRRFFPTQKGKQEYEYVTVDKYFSVEAKTLAGDSWYWFIKKIRYGFRYSYSPWHKFATEKEAQQLVNRYKNRVLLRVTPVNERTQVKVLKKNLAQ